MYSKVVAIIPARKGSKRLPGKNKRELCGKPLIEYTIEETLKCAFIDEIIITSDDIDILGISHKYLWKKIRFSNRPEKLAQDDTPIDDVVLHELETYSDLTTVILLQPTTPLRTSYDISQAYNIFKRRISCPLVPVFRDGPYHFKLNGAVFISSLANLRLTKSFLKGEFLCVYIMPKERSVDIDTIEDFEEAERLMKERLNHD